jgi:hypothetical protein
MKHFAHIERSDLNQDSQRVSDAVTVPAQNATLHAQAQLVTRQARVLAQEFHQWGRELERLLPNQSAASEPQRTTATLVGGMVMMTSATPSSPVRLIGGYTAPDGSLGRVYRYPDGREYRIPEVV